MVNDRVYPVLVTSILFTSLAFTSVVLRLLSRGVVLHQIGIDDYFMLGSVSASIGFMVVVMHQIKFGLGEHMQDLSPENTVRFFQCLWATIPVYNLTLVLCKLSVVVQYKRVFGTPLVQKLCKGMLGVLAVYGCWTVIGSTFMCVPVQFFWGEGEGSCMDRLAFWFSNAALNITTDVMIFALPVPLIRKLQIPKTQKIILMVVFTFGLFVCVTSIIRLQSLLSISVSPDTSFDGVNIATWSGVEINVAIICASVPALKPLVNAIFPKLLGSTRSRSNMRSGNDAGGQYYKQKDSQVDDHTSVRMKTLPSSSQHTHSQSSTSRHSRSAIRVEQTFEVRDGGNAAAARDSGSERNLVTWAQAMSK